MRLCFPVKEDKGQDSKIFDHFGSAPKFLIVDTDTGAITPVDNGSHEHGQGTCLPVRTLGSAQIDVMILPQIGAGALNGLKSMNIEVLQADGSTIKENVVKYQAGQLKEMASMCAGHGHGQPHRCGNH